MLWDSFLYCINDSIQGNSETGNKVFVLPSKVAINIQLQYVLERYLLIDVLIRHNTSLKNVQFYMHDLQLNSC